jgi:alpha-ketoglutarate-dependent taurine dioxygenase
MTDVSFDDGSPLDESLLDELDHAISSAAMPIAMEEGDVVLLDTYSVLHGRNTFSGQRQHGVLWLDDAPTSRGDGDGDDRGAYAPE